MRRMLITLLLVAVSFLNSPAHAATPSRVKIKDLINIWRGPWPVPLQGAKGGVFYFGYERPTDGSGGSQLAREQIFWGSDGSSGGTTFLDLNLIGGAASREEIIENLKLYPEFLGAMGWKIVLIHRTDDDPETYLWAVDIWRRKSVRLGPARLFNHLHLLPAFQDDEASLYIKDKAGTVWQSDCTTAGTRVIATIGGAGDFWSVQEGRILLNADREPSVGVELYRHTIATSQTTLIADLRPGEIVGGGRTIALSSNPHDLRRFKDHIYFNVITPERRLYRFNDKLTSPQLVYVPYYHFAGFAREYIIFLEGLPGGRLTSMSADLQQVHQLAVIPDQSPRIVEGDRNVFVFGDTRPDNTCQVWMTDGTPAGTTSLILDSSIRKPNAQDDCVGIGSRLFFRAADFEYYPPSPTDQIWCADFRLGEVKQVTHLAWGDDTQNTVPVLTGLGGDLFAVHFTPSAGFGLYRYAIEAERNAARHWRALE